MDIQEIIKALFGQGKAAGRMSPEDEAAAQAVLMQATGPGMAQEMAPQELARQTGPDTIEVGPKGAQIAAMYGRPDDFVDSVDGDTAQVMDQSGRTRSEPARGRREGQGGKVDVAEIYRRRNRMKAGDDGGDIKL